MTEQDAPVVLFDIECLCGKTARGNSQVPTCCPECGQLYLVKITVLPPAEEMYVIWRMWQAEAGALREAAK